jgi:DNA polymerase-3 subunit gamma/tau
LGAVDERRESDPLVGAETLTKQLAGSHDPSDRGIPSGKGWNHFKAFVKRKDAALCAKIESAQCFLCEEGRLRLGFAKGYLFREDVDARKKELEDLARQFFSRETVLDIETLAPDAAGADGAGPNGNGPAGKAARNHRLQEIRREALSHPLVQKILDVFPNAEVREVKLREAPAEAQSTSLSGSMDMGELPHLEEDFRVPEEGAAEK